MYTAGNRKLEHGRSIHSANSKQMTYEAIFGNHYVRYKLSFPDYKYWFRDQNPVIGRLLAARGEYSIAGTRYSSSFRET